MPKKSLVIVESPSKAKTINKYLGNDYKVIASVGHIKNLPKSKIGVDFDNGYEAVYETIPGKEKVIHDLKLNSKNSDVVYIATDPDREGEAIAFDIAQEIRNENNNIKRILFNEITKTGIQEGLSNPLEIDGKLVDSQQARRVLDRIVGYKISPFLWKVIYYGLSAGRVQSVALRLICEREDEIDNFNPVEYWSIIADFRDTDKNMLFQAKLIRKNNIAFKFTGEEPKINNEQEAQEIIDDLNNKSFKVADINKKEVRRNPLPPFITSSLQQDASNKLRYPPKRTMMIAQKLYEGLDIGEEGLVGLITYMRTDSTRISEGAISEARDYIKNEFGKEYLPHNSRHYTKKGKNAQDAHEAIRPTSVMRTPATLKGKITPEQLKLYDLIWKRFVASQMESAVFDQITLIIESVDKGKEKSSDVYQFRSTDTKIKFPGFLKLYKDTSESNAEEEEEFAIPEGIEVGDSVKCENLNKNQHYTSPPPRYTESSLIKQLDALGIGRPSTYALIVSTIINRTYVNLEDRKLFPTELGKTVNRILTNYFPDIFDVEFTANMELELDKVAAGELTYKKVLDDFYSPFNEDMQHLDEQTKEIKESLVEPTDIICDKCGINPMVIKWGRNGRFLSCTGYPKCKNAKPLPHEQDEHDILAEGKICQKCNSPMVVKSSRFGKFLGCSRYPDCDFIMPITLGIKCPKCKEGEIIEKKAQKSRKKFYGCTRYPDCDFIVNFKPVIEKCDVCGNDYMLEKTSKKTGKHLECPECKNKKILEEEPEENYL